ncbi:MAG: hypothetical protein WC340_15805, partial [Kiritimatiellia bacterium]
NTPDSPAKTPEGYTTQGGNFWTLITPEIWKVLHAVLQTCAQHPERRGERCIKSFASGKANPDCIDNGYTRH